MEIKAIDTPKSLEISMVATAETVVFGITRTDS
jgi:hypothetical protein